MGERITPECDIFKTLQPKGLRSVRVRVTEDIGITVVEHLDSVVHIGTPGFKRALRLATEATQPPKKHQQPAEGADDVG